MWYKMIWYEIPARENRIQSLSIAFLDVETMWLNSTEALHPKQ
jgi:hypothetical protein